MTPTFTRTDPPPGAHAVSDKRPATAYDVTVDGTHIGTVFSRSEQNWNKVGRIRTSMNGHSRYWAATAAFDPTFANYPGDRTVTRIAYTRQNATDDLVAAWTDAGRPATNRNQA